MKRMIVATIGLFALSAVGCEAAGWQGEPVSLENNSDQTVILRRTFGDPPSAHPMVTALPHQTATKPYTLPKDSCYGGFSLVDEAGNQLRALDKVCANETVVYP